MLEALARRTARLPHARGAAVAFPDNTDDAIVTGIADAQAGAVERIAARFARQQGGAVTLLLGGGAAAALHGGCKRARRSHSSSSPIIWCCAACGGARANPLDETRVPRPVAGQRAGLRVAAGPARIHAGNRPRAAAHRAADRAREPARPHGCGDRQAAQRGATQQGQRRHAVAELPRVRRLQRRSARADAVAHRCARSQGSARGAARSRRPAGTSSTCRR